MAGWSLPPLSVSLQGDGSSFDQMMDNSSNAITRFEASARASFTQFNDNIVHSVSIMDDVTAEVQREMEDHAIKLSLTSRNSASSLAEAYYHLASTGRTTESTIASAAVVDRFATAGRIGLAQATEMAAAAQTGLGMRSKDAAEDAKQLTRVTDVLVHAANIAQGSVTDFATALTSRAAGALRMVNKDIEEGTAVLMVYHNQGIPAYKAGWLLNTMLRELGQAAIRKADAWKSMNLTLYESDGRMKKLADIVEMFENTTRGMSDETRTATLNQLGFNGELLNSMSPLMGLSKEIRDFKQVLDDAEGAVQRVYDIQMRSFSAQLGILKNSITAVKLEIERALLPSMMALNSWLISMIQKWFLLSEETKTWIAYGVKAAAVAAALAASLVSMVATIGLVAIAGEHAFPAISRSLALIRMAASTALLPLLPYLLVAGAIAAVIAGIAYFIIGPEGITEGWKASIAWLNAFSVSVRGFFANFSENMGIIFTWFASEWKNMFLDAAEITGRVIVAMTKNYGLGLELIVRLVVAFVGWLVRVLPEAWNYVMSTQFQLAVLEGVAGAMEAYHAWFSAVIKGFGQWAQVVLKIVNTLAMEVAKATVNLAIETASMLADIAAGNIPSLAEIGTRVGRVAGDAVKNIAMAVAPEIEMMMDLYDEKMTMLRGDFAKGVMNENFFDTASEIMQDQLGKMTTGLEDFEARTKALPQLNLALPTPLEEENKKKEKKTELEEATDEANDALNEIEEKKEEIAKPITIKVSTEFEAVGRGSAEAYDRIAAYGLTLGQHFGSRANSATRGPSGGGRSFEFTGQGTSDDGKELLNQIEQNTRSPRNLIEISNADLAKAAGVA